MLAREGLVTVLLSAALLMLSQHFVNPISSRSQREQPSSAPALFRVTTTVIQFDAQVFDRDGRSVVSLTRDSFEVLQDGVPVVLKDVTFIARRAAEARAGSTNSEATSGRPVEPLVFLIDDMAMTPDGFQRVRDGLRDFVERGLSEGLEVGILRTGETGRRTTTLSGDRSVLIERIGGMRYLARSFRRGLASGSGVSGPDGRGVERPFTEGTLGSLTSLLADLRRLPGRKVVVLLSQGVALDLGGENAGTSLEDRMNRLGQLGALAGVTTHCIDVAGVQGEFTGLKEGLVSIAEKLGGRYFDGGNELTAAFKRLSAMEEGYYLLSYEPPPGTFVLKQPPPFRKLTVRVRGKDLDVRTRRGFFGGDYR
jgi:VWFA-related protein